MIIELIILIIIGIVTTTLDTYSTIMNFKCSEFLNKNKKIRDRYEKDAAKPREMNSITSSLHKRFGLVRGQIIKYIFNILVLIVLCYGFYLIGKAGYLILGIYVGVILRQFTSVYFHKRIIDAVKTDP